MRLEVVRGGGVAGIVTTTRIGTDSLPPEAAAKGETKVRRSSLVSAAAPEADAPPAHPDDLLYEVTVEDDGERHSRRFTDASLPDDVRSLIAWVDSRPERRFS